MRLKERSGPETTAAPPVNGHVGTEDETMHAVVDDVHVLGNPYHILGLGFVDCRPAVNFNTHSTHTTT